MGRVGSTLPDPALSPAIFWRFWRVGEGKGQSTQGDEGSSVERQALEGGTCLRGTASYPLAGWSILPRGGGDAAHTAFKSHDPSPRRGDRGGVIPPCPPCTRQRSGGPWCTTGTARSPYSRRPLAPRSSCRSAPSIPQQFSILSNTIDRQFQGMARLSGDETEDPSTSWVFIISPARQPDGVHPFAASSSLPRAHYTPNTRPHLSLAPPNPCLGGGARGTNLPEPTMPVRHGRKQPQGAASPAPWEPVASESPKSKILMMMMIRSTTVKKN